jgi:hypothetical protein
MRQQQIRFKITNLISYVTHMLQVKLREKGQVTIPAELLQEWQLKNHVEPQDVMQACLANGVLMLIPAKRHAARRDMLSFAGVGKGLWGQTQAEIESSIAQLRSEWTR